jgi:hypothetical protein
VRSHHRRRLDAAREDVLQVPLHDLAQRLVAELPAEPLGQLDTVPDRARRVPARSLR